MSVIAFVLLLAFAIDRMVTGLLFVLSYLPRWRRLCPDPVRVADAGQKALAERAQKIAFVIFAGILSSMVLWLVGSGILHQVGFKEGRLDTFLTALILMGGAERVSEISKSFGSATAVSEPPIQIKGTLTLEEGTSLQFRGQAAGSGRS
jgi:hypothetical protein